MKKIILYLFALVLLFSACTPPLEPRVTSAVADHGQIYYAEHPKAFLFLFPGYRGDAKSIENEFKVVERANEQGINVVLMNFNQHLMVSNEELNTLTELFKDELLRSKADIPFYIGGYSSGGNVSFLLADHLLADPSRPQPSGVFCVDSPLDLHRLYRSANCTIERNFAQPAMQEANMLLDFFETNFGTPQDSLFRYEAAAVYTDSTQNTQNISHLNQIKVRLYTEPDTTWWMKERGASYRDMNASILEALSSQLQTTSNSSVELIRTSNKGYRADGRRHPHSWSIVDQDELFKWVLEEQ